MGNAEISAPTTIIDLNQALAASEEAISNLSLVSGTVLGHGNVRFCSKAWTYPGALAAPSL